MKKAIPLLVVLVIGFWIAQDKNGFSEMSQSAVAGAIDMIGAVGSWIIGAVSQ